jgi:tetratricopeptide (TPR) repeat protein
MKIIVCLFSVVVSFISFGQDWRVALDNARKAYRATNFEEALKYYKIVQAKAPKSLNFSDEIAQTTYKAVSYEKANEAYKKSLQQKKTAYQKAQSLHNLGNVDMQKKQYQEAIEHYKKALKQNSSDEQTRYNLSQAIRQLKKQQAKNQPKNKPNNSPKDPKKNQQPKPQNQPAQKNNPQPQQANLAKKMSDRLLDQLAKAEIATKQKVSGNKKGKRTTNSRKDW